MLGEWLQEQLPGVHRPCQVECAEEGWNDQVLVQQREDILCCCHCHKCWWKSFRSPQLCCAHVELSLKEATESLKSMAKGSEVLDLPDGDPLSMFSFIPGRSKDLNVFWDSGGLHLMMKSDVPEKELPAVRTRKGPKRIKGAGDTNITVGGEWIVLVPKADGKQKILE